MMFILILISWNCFAGADRPLSNSKGPQRSAGGRERMDNRRERGDRDDRPPRAPRTGRPRLSSKEKVKWNSNCLTSAVSLLVECVLLVLISLATT